MESQHHEPGGGPIALDRIHADPVAFLATQDDPCAKGEPITLPDGSVVPRLPGYRRWLWDGEFAGIIAVRWQPGSVTLPEHVLGHVGYTIVPWKRGRGYATAALRDLLPSLGELGLPYVELSTDVGNLASQHVIMANGGVLVERFTRPAAFGSDSLALRWRINLDRQPANPNYHGTMRCARLRVATDASADVPEWGGYRGQS